MAIYPTTTQYCKIGKGSERERENRINVEENISSTILSKNKALFRTIHIGIKRKCQCAGCSQHYTDSSKQQDYSSEQAGKSISIYIYKEHSKATRKQNIRADSRQQTKIVKGRRAGEVCASVKRVVPSGCGSRSSFGWVKWLLFVSSDAKFHVSKITSQLSCLSWGC